MESPSFVDGNLTIADIIHKTKIPEFNVLRTLYGFISSGLVQITTKIEKEKVPEGKDEDKEGGLFGFFRKR